MGNSQNIVVGLQAENTIKAAVYGESEANARDLGFIKGGISIEHDETSHDIKVDQALGAIDKVVTDEKMKIKVTLSEATLHNLALAYGYDSSAAQNGSFAFGAKENAKFFTLYINVKGVNGGLRKYCFWKVKPTGKTTQSYKRDGETVAEAEFEVLTDTTKPAQQRFGMVEDSAVSGGQAPQLSVSSLTLGAGTLESVVINSQQEAQLSESSVKYANQTDGTLFVYTQGDNPMLVGANAVYDADGKKIIITPLLPWAQGSYTLIASAGIKDIYGLHLAAPLAVSISAV